MFTGPHAEEPIFRKPATQARLPSKAFEVYGGIGQNLEKSAKLS
jgi:hypothetical protein